MLPLGTGEGFCGSLGREQTRPRGCREDRWLLGGSLPGACSDPMAPGSQRDPQSCPHPPGINSCWERTERMTWRGVRLLLL